MYIGDTTNGSGLHNMIYELVCNAIKEASIGFADRIDVVLNPDGSCTVRDNGRGLPAEPHPTSGLSAAEIIMTQLHAGGEFERHPHDVPDELHGVGAAVVNALSETLVLRIWRNGVEHAMRFREGAPETRLKVVGTADLSSARNPRGTEITFTPIKDVFADTEFDFARIEHRLRELAVHARGAAITLKDERPDRVSETMFRA
jgi:DNA gyrase subunit B